MEREPSPAPPRHVEGAKRPKHPEERSPNFHPRDSSPHEGAQNDALGRGGSYFALRARAALGIQKKLGRGGMRARAGRNNAAAKAYPFLKGRLPRSGWWGLQSAHPHSHPHPSARGQPPSPSRKGRAWALAPRRLYPPPSERGGGCRGRGTAFLSLPRQSGEAPVGRALAGTQVEGRLGLPTSSPNHPKNILRANIAQL